jgi:hypothetical protein
LPETEGGLFRMDLKVGGSRWRPPGKYMGSCGRGPGGTAYWHRLDLRVEWRLQPLFTVAILR